MIGGGAGEFLRLGTFEHKGHVGVHAVGDPGERPAGLARFEASVGELVDPVGPTHEPMVEIPQQVGALP
jgi:hypothetical protein